MNDQIEVDLGQIEVYLGQIEVDLGQIEVYLGQIEVDLGQTLHLPKWCTL